MNYKDDYNYWLESVPAEEKKELQNLSDDDIKRRFAVPLGFGTAGMRGIISLGTGCINKYTVARATKGVADYVNSLGSEACARGVVISYDTRNFSYEFAKISAEVLAKNGVKAYLFNDVRPVPVCSFAVRYLKAVAGIMITASHNPKEYNGYKVYGEDGAQMALEATEKVVNYIDSISDYFSVEYDNIEITREEIQSINDKEIAKNVTVIGKSVDDAYFKEIEKLTLSPEEVTAVSCKLKIVYTPIHGAGYKPVTEIFRRMGIPYSVVESQVAPDGNFPTVVMPNPEQPDALKLGIALARDIRSGIVIGTDPDCDRMGVAIKNDKGEFVTLTGNQIGAMILEYILKRKAETNTLPSNGAVVKTIVTTKLADKIAKSYGMTVYNVLTGFKFIGEKIKEWEENGKHTFIFGYEESFGYLSGTHARDKDAVVASMLFAEMACYYESKGITLYQALQNIFTNYGYFSEISKSYLFAGLDGMSEMSAVMDKLKKSPIKNIAGIPVEKKLDYSSGIAIDSMGNEEKIDLPKANVIKFEFNADEWACVRPSGTEPKLKIYVSVQSDTREKADKRRADVLGFLEELIK